MKKKNIYIVVMEQFGVMDDFPHIRYLLATDNHTTATRHSLKAGETFKNWLNIIWINSMRLIITL